MNSWIKFSMLGLALVLAACSGGEEEIATEDVALLDTPSMAMPQGGMRGGMGAMAGMDPQMMGSQWQQHMATMQAAAGDSLGAMMPMHRQMVTRMMETMSGRMGMAMDSSMMATRDSLRRDLDRMQDMTPEEMDEFLQQHDARMQRMLRIHQAAQEQSPPQ